MSSKGKRRWNAADIASLREMDRDNCTPTEMRVVLERPLISIYSKLYQLGLRLKHAKIATTPMRCLTCQTNFPSTDRSNNRICPNCKDNEVFTLPEQMWS